MKTYSTTEIINCTESDKMAFAQLFFATPLVASSHKATPRCSRSWEINFAELFLDEWWRCRCDPAGTRFPAVCTTNHTLIDGELFLDEWWRCRCDPAGTRFPAVCTTNHTLIDDELFVDEWWRCSCDPAGTRFPAVCTTNHTLIDGELFLDEWRINFTPMYADLLALMLVIVACRVAGYLVLRYLRRPQI